MIRALILDRDGLIVHGCKDPSSPFYYILDADDLVLKPNVKTAFSLIRSLAAHHHFKVILATKQRCISKGLISRPQVDVLNRRLEEKLDYRFDAIYVEETEHTKQNLFARILVGWDLTPSDVLVLDDSRPEVMKACALGCQGELTTDLYGSICARFNIS